MTCVFCPTDWRFWYRNHAVWKYTKFGVYRTELIEKIENAKTINDIPREVLEDFEGQAYNNFIYVDESIAIIESCDTREEKDITHVLIFPIQHVERLNIFKYPELSLKMYSAADMITKLSGFQDASYGLSTKMIDDYMPHTHLHVQTNTLMTWDKMRDALYPYFYKDSEFYSE